MHIDSRANGNYQTNAYYMNKLKKQVNLNDVKVPICYNPRRRAIPIYSLEELEENL